MSLKSQWESYLKEVVPSSAGEVQKIEIRRAFYAGAVSLRHLLLNTPDEEEDEMQACDALYAELLQFQKDLADGKA